MRILAITNLFPSTREPTRGVFNLQAFSRLARRTELRVVVPVPWWQPGWPASGWLRPWEECVEGVPAVYPTYWSVPRVGQAMHAHGMYLSLRGLVARMRREFPFDIILAAWAYPDGVAAARLAAKHRVPLVTMVLGSDVNELARRPQLRRQIRWGLGQAGRVLTVSRALADRVEALGIPRERVVVRHNGVDGERFFPRDRSALRRELGLPDDRPLVCYVGNLKPEKGAAVLVEAMVRLRRHHHRADVLLLVVGGGPLEDSMRRRVEAAGLQEQVQFCGRRPHAETAAWIGAADMLCLPSFREGCPNVVLEALACGRPVVASAVGGVPELIDGRCGALVPAGNPEALADALAGTLAARWEPEALRARVPYLSWNGFAAGLLTTLEAARAEYRPGAGRAPWNTACASFDPAGSEAQSWVPLEELRS